jgi:two-component system NtrC family sensor kinase
LFYSTRSKLILGILGVTLLVGTVSLLVGGQLLYEAFLNEATQCVRQDLNAAREIYSNRLQGIKAALEISSLGNEFRSAVRRQDTLGLVTHLRSVSQSINLDFSGVVLSDGRTLCRVGPNPIAQEERAVSNPVADLAIRRGSVVAGTVLLSQAFLSHENPELARLATIELRPTPRAAGGGACRKRRY